MKLYFINLMFVNRFRVIHRVQKRDITENIEYIPASPAIKVRMRGSAGVKSFPPGIDIKFPDFS
jgi:hypothetical protein